MTTDLPSLPDAAWADALRAALRSAPGPERALLLADRILAAQRGESIAGLATESPEGLARVLVAVCGSAPFLASHLVRHPDWLGPLALDPLDSSLDIDALGRALDAALDASELADAERVLREHKYGALLRITVRDCSPECLALEHSGETLTDMSRLADVLLDRSLQVAQQRILIRARGDEDAGGRLCVLGFGKLGTGELNFSSDVDLVYLASGRQPGEAPPLESLTRVSREFGRLVGTVTADGFLYRIDLDLRPEGGAGPMVVSEDMFTTYYETAAADWEKVAFMKARPVAGDAALGWRAIRTVEPMVYGTAVAYSGVERIRKLKDQIRSTRGGDERGFDVKLDPGGIRDVEFVAQGMQLLHGGRIPQLHTRSTQDTLLSLGQVRLLDPADASALLGAYRFLRRVENRLQMEEERQVHKLPAEPAARELLARRVGFGGDAALADFDAALSDARARVTSVVDAFLPEGGAEAVNAIFARRAGPMAAQPGMGEMLAGLARHFAREIEARPESEHALNNLDRFLEGLGSRRFYYELLLDRPELVPRLAALFSTSRYLSTLLARHPRLIEPVFEHPSRLLLDREELCDDLAALVADVAEGEGPADFEQSLEALRLFHHRQTLNIGLLDVASKVARADVERALSDLAEVCLTEALAIASRELAHRTPAAADGARFLVVAMGKLASRELSYGSDLDLIFLYDVRPPDRPDAYEAQEHFVRLTQRLVSALQTPTSEGSCYEIDARLRPSGNQGSLVTSLDAFRRYHDGKAAGWERQILLRARPVVGDADLAEAFEALRREILSSEPPDDLAPEIRRIRQRMEAELASETASHRDFKRGRGGLLDVESAVQFLQTRHAAAHAELLDVERIEVLIERLEALGLLPDAEAAALTEGWEFLQRLGSQLRIVENRSISDLDAERGDLDALARHLTYEGGGRESSARRALLRDYDRHTEAIRAAYDAILGAG